MKLARAVLVIAAIAFVVMVVYAARRQVDSDRHQTYLATLSDLRSLNAGVNETVLNMRLGHTLNADLIDDKIVKIGEVHARLREVPPFLLAPDRSRVLATIAESEKFQRERRIRVRHFVADDAQLAASVRILAPETEALAVAVDAAGRRTLADHARTLRVEVLELVASRELGHLAEIQDAIAAVRADEWPNEADKRAMSLLVAHVSKVVHERGRVDQLTNEIVTNDARGHAQVIEAAYLAGVDAARTSETRSIIVLFALAMVMLGAASAYVIARLRASGEELGAATAKLTTAMTALQAERAKERELAELKTRFVAMTSHEFRTPLSVISSSSELLQSYGERWATEKRSEHLARIRRSVNGMTTMLDRILLIGKTEAGMLEFRPASVALDRLCLEIAHSAELADGGKRRVVSDVADALGVARADEKLVRHVLENVLSNAVKYSPEGAAVRFVATREGDDVVFVVEDRGIGIPEEDRARLFDGFHRAKNALHISGTGLGLAVVKRAVELHGGTITFRSVVGEGTTFTVRMRAEREEP